MTFPDFKDNFKRSVFSYLVVYELNYQFIYFHLYLKNVIQLQGDVDYVKIKEALDTNPEEYLYSNMKDGFQRLKVPKTIMCELRSAIRATYKNKPKTVPDMKIFWSGKDQHFGTLCTRNSPLIPIFRKAAAKTLENGLYSRSSSKWVGGAIKSKGAADTMILSIGQMFIAFLFIFLFVIVSLFSLFLECLYIKGPSIFKFWQIDWSANNPQFMASLQRRKIVSENIARSFLNKIIE